VSGAVLIVGGGIAGLALAASLSRAGRACEIVERAAAWAPVGAGIGMSPNAVMALRSIGAEPALQERGYRIREATLTDISGRVLSCARVEELETRFAPTFAIHRAELHAILLGAAAGVPIRMDGSVDQLTERGDAVEVRFSDGREGSYAAVIGADGVGSRVRGLLAPATVPRYVGYTTWRFVASRPPGLEGMAEMWGRGLRFGLVPIDAEHIYCYAAANAAEGEQDLEAGRLERFRARFAGFGGDAPAALERLQDAAALLHNDVFEVVSPRWAHGRVVLLGDAAHAMTPDMGQGAAMALEDAISLSHALQERGVAPGTLASWEAQRRPRVDAVQARSHRLGRTLQAENALLNRIRDAVVRLTPDFVAVGALARFARGAPVGAG